MKPDTGELFFLEYLNWLEEEKPNVNDKMVCLCNKCTPKEPPPPAAAAPTQAAAPVPPAVTAFAVGGEAAAAAGVLPVASLMGALGWFVSLM